MNMQLLDAIKNYEDVIKRLQSSEIRSNDRSSNSNDIGPSNNSRTTGNGNHSNHGPSTDSGAIGTTNSSEGRLAKVTEIKSFLMRLRTESTITKNASETSSSSIQNDRLTTIRIREQLLQLGNVILAPLLRENNSVKANMEDNEFHQESQRGGSARADRSKPHFLLPLELIPAILDTMDALDDNLHMFNHRLEKKEESNNNSKGENDGDLSMVDWDGDSAGKIKCLEDDLMMNDVPSSDKLLSCMFASVRTGGDTGENIKLERTMRADAALPLLSLAMDDIGCRRMSSTVPAINEEDREGEVTYWDCLKVALMDAIRSNLTCYSSDDTDDASSGKNTKMGESKQQIIDEALSDEGIHIIPLADYPALIRCIFRMISTTATATSSSNSASPLRITNSPSWESLLLQLYHAAAVATSVVPLQQLPSLHYHISMRHRPKFSSHQRQATFSTVESHVLLPSCTGASVSTIKAILQACIYECCPSCKQQVTVKSSGFFASKQRIVSHDNSVVPTWAVAGIVLLIMRARASNMSHSSTGFGQRNVFRMSSNILRKIAAYENNNQQRKRRRSAEGIGEDDEVGYALKVLLHLSGIKKGRCRMCCDDRINEDTEQSASDVLKYSYYAGNDHFPHRYSTPEEKNGEESYRHELGLCGLSSYSNLVRASLNHGALSDNSKTQSLASFISETAQTWIDAANMLLDESYSSRVSGDKSSSGSIPYYGTAMAIVAIVVIFFEVPSSQDAIVRSIYDRLAKMASSSGSRSEESCFLLISTLAWSLAARADERHKSMGVIRRKGDVDDTSVLGPLCNLLSKSALARDQYLDGMMMSCNKTTQLSYWVLRQLASALVPVLSGREIILALAQKNMRVLPTSSPYSHSSLFFESLPTSPSATSDTVYLAIYCLCLLIEKYSFSKKNTTWDDCGRAALGIITDVIILQRLSPTVATSHSTPRVPAKIVSWMLCKLNKSARMGKLTKWVSRRLLRACFKALLQCTAFNDTEVAKCSPLLLEENIYSMNYTPPIYMHNEANDEANGFASTLQSSIFQDRYDVPGMLRLAVSLYNEIVKSDENTHFDIAQSILESTQLLKPHLLRILLGENDNVLGSTTLEEGRDKNAADQVFEEGYGLLQRGFNTSDEMKSSLIDGTLLIIFFQGAARIIRKESFGRIDTDINLFENLNKYVHDTERHCYCQGGDGSMVQKHGSCLPGWLKSHLPPIDASKRHWESNVQKIDKTSLEYKLFHMSLCDILAEILLQNWAHTDGVKQSDQAPEMSLLRGVNLVLESKRNVNDLMANPSSDEPLFSGISHNTISNFFCLSAQQCRPLLSTTSKKKYTLPEVNVLVKNALELCKVIQTKRVPQYMSSQIHTLSSLWALYCALADDESSQLLSSVVKEYYVETGEFLDPETNVYDINEASFSLLRLTSSEDLDYHIRYLRGVFLSILSRVVTTISVSQNEMSPEGQNSSIVLLLQILPQLCQDLDAAFLGYSGGITKSLMLLFLDLIDKCVDAIAAIFESMPRRFQYQIRSSFVSVHQAGLIIWGVFCDKPLPQASVIKGVLRLCIDKMPTMVGSVERVLDECIINKPLRYHASELLDQCNIFSTSTKVELEAKKNTMKSGTVTCSDESDGIGARESTGAKISSQDIVEEADGDEDINLKIVKDKIKAKLIESESRPGYSNSNIDGTYILKASDAQVVKTLLPNFSTSEKVQWAYNCAFVAVANFWNNSYQIITGGDKMKRRSVASIGENSTSLDWQTYSNPAKDALALRRIEGFSHLHSSLCRIFEGKTKQEDNTEESLHLWETAKIPAEFLSYYGKSHLCACVEKMSMTLSVAAKQIIKCFKTPINVTSFTEAMLVESIICVLGWLHSIKTKETKHNIFTGPLQWYINEKRNFDLSSFGKSSKESYPILGRLPKLLYRLEGLEAEIRKLHVIILNSLSSKEGDFSTRTLFILNEKASVLCREEGKQEIGSFMDMFQQCIQTIDSCKKEIKIRENNDHVFSGEEQSDLDVEGDDKQQKRRFSPVWKSRKMSLRSRNETIDNWLRMDDDEFASAPGEKYNINDAFVDLEDFIVEG